MTDAIKHSVGIATAAVRVGINLVRDVVAFFAAAPDPTPEEDALNSAIRGGELNHRTGRFDDGTDPAGWYERD
ncbi:MAG: hypothetical protein KF911_10935 [Pseudomonadales bacterium]|nr:hypothetical protein [Pseudomonadales bacterium]